MFVHSQVIRHAVREQAPGQLPRQVEGEVAATSNEWLETIVQQRSLMDGSELGQQLPHRLLSRAVIGRHIAVDKLNGRRDLAAGMLNGTVHLS